MNMTFNKEGRIVLQDNEKWISGLEGQYSITKEGDVVSYKRGRRVLNGAVLKQRGKDTYRCVCITVKGKQITIQNHRIVAETFVPNPENKPLVSHRDGNNLNNNVDNIYWSTQSEVYAEAKVKGFILSRAFDEDKISERVKEAIFEKYNRNLHKKFISPDRLKENNIPPEFMSCTVCKDNILNSWNHYIQLFRLCDDKELTLFTVAYITGMDESAISLIRNGKRLVKARKIYDKYKDDNYYLKHFSKIYKTY